MPVNKALLDLAIRRQVTLEKLKARQVRDFSKVFSDISALVRLEFSKLGELTSVKRQTVSKLLGTYETKIRDIYKEQIALFTPQLEKVAGVYASMEGIDIMSSLPGGVEVASATPKQAFRLAKTRAMGHSGEIMNEFIGKLATGETSRVVNTVRQGFFQGQTNQQILRSVVGTKAANFKDGILDVSRRNAKTVINTSFQHVASVGRMATWKANEELFTGYQWVSTLDSITSNKCKSLDGQEFEKWVGPLPPIHPNCRSTTIAVLNSEFDFLSEGRTRSAEFGPINGKQSYYDWLKTQDADFQEQALGPARSKLFRDGGLSAEKFRALQLDKNFDPLTLAEMKVLEPEAFKLAGL